MIELLRLSVSKHAVVETDLGNGLPAVEANPGQLRQVVMNLVTNASEAIGGRDGMIRVTTARATVGQDSSVSTTESLVEGDYLQLEVTDTGCGMSADTQARIFDPFFTTKPLGHGPAEPSLISAASQTAQIWKRSYGVSSARTTRESVWNFRYSLKVTCCSTLTFFSNARRAEAFRETSFGTHSSSLTRIIS
jgi:hypothetical protein